MLYYHKTNKIKKNLFPCQFSGSKYFDHVQFSGTTYAQDDECYGYMGFIFGYQSTQKYYVALWRHRYTNMDDRGGTKGVQIRVCFLKRLKTI